MADDYVACADAIIARRRLIIRQMNDDFRVLIRQHKRLRLHHYTTITKRHFAWWHDRSDDWAARIYSIAVTSGTVWDPRLTFETECRFGKWHVFDKTFDGPAFIRIFCPYTSAGSLCRSAGYALPWKYRYTLFNVFDALIAQLGSTRDKDLWGTTPGVPLRWIYPTFEQLSLSDPDFDSKLKTVDVSMLHSCKIVVGSPIE